MEIKSTAKIKIITNESIVKTVEVYKKALQFCIDTAWSKNIKNNIKLHPFVYYEIKKMGLQSQLAIACIKQACGIVKKSKSKPEIKHASMRYNFPRSASLKNNILSIATIDGRKKFEVNVPECYIKYFEDSSWELSESLLNIDKKQRTFFMFVFSKEIDQTLKSKKRKVLGIDIGINNIAVTSDKRFFGKQTKNLHIKHDKLVSQLQSKGTKSAKRKLNKISGRWKRFMKWTNHNISKSITKNLKKGDIVVMEDLKYIRKSAKYNKWVHKWAFNQLQNFIEYKAIRKGCRVVYINPAYTSKTCSRCKSRDTVRHSGFVKCLHCGYSLNSDLCASKNIAQSYMETMCFGAITHRNVSDDDSKADISTSELRMSSGINTPSL